MQFYKTVERIHYANQLIKLESTGTPNEFAQRLHLKRSQIFVFLEELKDYGAPIRYSRIHETYYYTEFYDIIIDIRIFNGTEERKIF
jgi:hypothetical protein